MSVTMSTNDGRRPHGMALQFVIPIVSLIVMLFSYRSTERFEFDTDEGINVMKAITGNLCSRYPNAFDCTAAMTASFSAAWYARPGSACGGTSRTCLGVKTLCRV